MDGSLLDDSPAMVLAFEVGVCETEEHLI